MVVIHLNFLIKCFVKPYPLTGFLCVFTDYIMYSMNYGSKTSFGIYIGYFKHQIRFLFF